MYSKQTHAAFLVFFALLALLCLVPVVGQAAEPTDEAYFEFNELTGEITSYKTEGNPPKDVVIPATIGGKTVTKIGRNAFRERGLTSVQFADGSQVKEIGGFAYNSTLTSVTFPSSLTSIGASAFASCRSLASVDLSGCTGLTSIGASAFASCRSLASMDLSGCTGLTSIGENAFEYCSSLASVDLSGCTSIGRWAFRECGLTSVIFPANLTSIEEGVFSGCSSLASVTFPTSLTSIGENAFYRNGLTSVDLSGCTGLTSIGNYAFSNCSKLQEILLKEHTVNSIAGAPWGSSTAAVYWITTIKVADKYVYESSTKEITKFLDSQATTANIVEDFNSTSYSVTSIRAYAFSGFKNLASVIFPASLTSIGNYAFAESGLTSVDLSGCTNLTSIRESAFQYCSSLASVIFPASLTSIGDYAFYKSGLTSVDLSGCTNLTNIGNYVFAKSGLTSVDLSGCTSLTSIGYRAFADCSSLASVTFPTSLTSIKEDAFYDCSNLASVDFSGCTNLTSIEEDAFSNCSKLQEILLKEHTVDSIAGAPWGSSKAAVYWNTTIKVANKYVYESSTKEITKFLDSNATAVNIVADFETTDYSVTSIGAYAFSGFKNLTSVIFPASLTSIEEDAFYDCSNLASVDFSGCTNLTNIGNYAFYESGLTSVIFPASLTSIGGGHFPKAA